MGKTTEVLEDLPMDTVRNAYPRFQGCGEAVMEVEGGYFEQVLISQL